MSKQRFSKVFTEALWIAHGKICRYCEEGLLFTHATVDHVIPEKYANDYSARADLLARIGQPEDFDILGYENLIIACSPCNVRKHARPLADGAIAIKLSFVKSRLEKLNELIECRRKERNLDNTLRHIARSIEAKKFSIEELTKGLEALRRHPDGIWGASPSAPPASPETRKLHINIRDDARIIWTDKAEKDLIALDFDADQLNGYLIDNLKLGGSELKKLVGYDGLYLLRAGDLRLEFQPTDEGTVVHAIERKHHSSGSAPFGRNLQ